MMKFKKPTNFGSNATSETIVIGNPQGTIGRIYINGSSQLARNDFAFALHRFGSVNGIKYSDYQRSVMNLFNK